MGTFKSKNFTDTCESCDYNFDEHEQDKTEQEAWDIAWEQLREEFGVNSCDNCGVIEDSLELIWIDAEDFEPLKKDIFNEDKYKAAIADGNSALCEKCYKEKCCD